ncbi:Hypothetical protein FKW44_008234 [Caligus rogercresseyi]|uniref:Uncharacterized protein n=1 Tax=Caligus rogercresseyi TaxID=217165 RepID=A0A7T8KFU6_CALRO|nr:Hypothetical protein FKW44_008234 [Caligus rogercresseyi]
MPFEADMTGDHSNDEQIWARLYLKILLPRKGFGSKSLDCGKCSLRPAIPLKSLV